MIRVKGIGVLTERGQAGTTKDTAGAAPGLPFSLHRSLDLPRLAEVAAYTM